MHHDEPSDDHTSGGRAWSDHRSDGEHEPSDSNAGELAGIPGAEVEQPDAGGEAEGSQGLQIALSHKGPLPSPATLAGYDQLVPGTAQRMIEQQLYNESVTSEAIRRLTKAEAFGVVTGAVGAQLLTIGGLVAAVTLIVLGYPAASIAGIIPAILGASTQVVTAWRSNRPPDED